MPLDLTRPIDSLLRGRVHRFATLWEIVRKDTIAFRFTDHDSVINFGGNSYTPLGGVQRSATERQAGLKSSDLELIGVLTSSAITDDDLYANRFDDAAVTVRQIDWAHPWAGAITTHSYRIIETVHDGETWRAKIANLTQRLRTSIGDVYGRLCRHELGDAKCGVSIFGFAALATIAAVDASEPRRIVETDLTEDDGFFNNGLIIVSGGPNNQLRGECAEYLQTDGKISLLLEMPFAFQVGNQLLCLPGCGKTVEDCKGTAGTAGRPWANNIVNHGGFPTIAGVDRSFETPDAKQ